MLEISCGTVPYTVRGGKIYYLLIKERRSGHCGFPKGHVERGESEMETALRETLEETSITPTITEGFREEITYRLSNGRKKTVIYFLAHFEDQAPRHNGGFEHFDYLLLPFNEAHRRLSFENTRAVLCAADAFLNENN